MNAPAPERRIIERIRQIIEHPDSSYRERHKSELRKLRRQIWKMDAERENRREQS